MFILFSVFFFSIFILFWLLNVTFFSFFSGLDYSDRTRVLLRLSLLSWKLPLDQNTAGESDILLNPNHWSDNLNPNHPKPFKLQQQGLLDFDGHNPDRDTLHGAGCPNFSSNSRVVVFVHGVGFEQVEEGS